MDDGLSELENGFRLVGIIWIDVLGDSTFSEFVGGVIVGSFEKFGK